MRSLNESIARRANQEDQCTGRFWEGRFKSQAILDEAGSLACCMYVDLNPVRAGIAPTLEDSDFTGIQQRLFEHAAQLSLAAHSDKKSRAKRAKTKPAHALASDTQAVTSAPISPPVMPALHPFGGSLSTDPAHGLPFQLTDYLELADWTARIVRADKRGATPEHTPPILQGLGFDTSSFLAKMQAHALKRDYVIGQVERLKNFAEHLQLQRRVGIGLPAVMPARIA